MQSFSKVRMLFLCLVLSLVLVATRASVVFEDCGSAYDLKSVNIEGCGLRLPCYVTLGDAIAVNVQFYADFASTKLDQDVVLDINYIHASTSVTPEPCVSVMCPVRTDAVTSFTSVMSVPGNMALNQRGYLHWRVHNESNKQVLCYTVMVQTQTYMQKFLRGMYQEAWIVNNNLQDDNLWKEYKRNENFYAQFKRKYINNTRIDRLF